MVPNWLNTNAKNAVYTIKAKALYTPQTAFLKNDFWDKLYLGAMIRQCDHILKEYPVCDPQQQT